MRKDENKYTKTSSYRHDKDYDDLVSNCDISSLRFLSEHYDDKLDIYKHTHNLDNREYWREYKNIQRRKKIIDEELSVRIMNQSAISTRYITEFDSMNNILYKNDDTNIQEDTRYVAFNENENGYKLYDNDDNIIDEFIVSEDDDNIVKKKKSRKEIYKDWDY